MHNINNKNELFDLLAQGAIVITPNNRLSAALLQQYFTYCDSRTVIKPMCLPYSTLIIHAYQQLKFLRPEYPHPLLLNETQCHHVWQKIIKTDIHITYSKGLLGAVMDAWKQCQLWQINPENQAFHYTPQTRQFQHWWQQCNKELKQLDVISEYQLMSYLLEVDAPLFTKPLIWVCFDDFNPQHLSLQHHVKQNGLEQYCYDLKEHGASPKVLAAQDSKEEYQQLISWLHLKIQQGEQRIGVVVPNLQQESRALQRLLLQHFDPSLFNTTLGQALNEFPLVSHALCWLNLDKQCSHQQATLMLQSPYIGAAKEEFNSRSQYLQDSALLQEQKFSLSTLCNDLNIMAPKLAEILNKINSYPQLASPQEWIRVFQERLNTLGFPGDYGLNSENYQCYNRLTAIFDEFRQLNLISPTLSRQEAMDALTQLVTNTIFQAQKTNAPIQISGLLEASGCEFDSLWVMGLTDQCLPQKPRLSAFIPPQLQRDLLMPHSTPARELNYAKQTLQRLQHGSRNSPVFSYSRLQGDSPNLPCALIAEFPDLELFPTATESSQKSFLIEQEETYLLPPKPEEQISGGTALLGNQAKCPFKAFAEHRLMAKPSSHVADGIDNKEKGKIIHKVLEVLWQSLGSQKKLFSLTSDDLNQLIDQAIHSALSPLKQLHPDAFPLLMQEIEYTRLKRLVLSCLEWEKQRPAFSIAAVEQSYSINLAGLDIKVRVDRLDDVDNQKWVIDYKSTLPSNTPWKEDRPKEPQLLLYALLDEQINAMLFMQVKTGKTICKGLSESKLDISGISSLKKDESWVASRDNWQQQLMGLAQEIQQGHCLPQPDSPSICQQCDFHNLCRI